MNSTSFDNTLTRWDLEDGITFVAGPHILRLEGTGAQAQWEKGRE